MSVAELSRRNNDAEPMLALMAKYGLPKDFPDDVLLLEEELAMDKCNMTSVFTQNDHLIASVSFWLERVFQASILLKLF